MAATELPPIERILFGPRREGRDFGVVAATPSLTLSDEALSCGLDYNLGIGDHYVGKVGAPCHALFQISYPPHRRLWMLSTTRGHPKIGGNSVWTTEGLILTQQHMEALHGRADLLLAGMMGGKLPAEGTHWKPLQWDQDALEAQAAKMAKAEPDIQGLDALAGPLFMEAMEENGRLMVTAKPTPTMLAKILAAIPEPERTYASWTTQRGRGPRDADIMFNPEPWMLTEKDRRIEIKDHRAETSTPAKIATVKKLPDSTWQNLLEAVSTDGSKYGEWLHERLMAHAQDASPAEDANTLALRISAVLNEVAQHHGEKDAREVQKYLYCILKRIPEGPSQTTVSSALGKTLHERLNQLDGWLWFQDAGQEFQPTAPLLLPRLLVQSGHSLEWAHHLPEPTLQTLVTLESSSPIAHQLLTQVEQNSESNNISVIRLWQAAVRSIGSETANAPLIVALNERLLAQLKQANQVIFSLPIGDKIRSGMAELVDRACQAGKPELATALINAANRDSLTGLLGKNSVDQLYETLSRNSSRQTGM